MLLTTIAACAYPAIPSGQKSTKKMAMNPRTQRGVTLVELLVGLAIGLLTIAVALGALMVSRGVSGTVSDASGIQQQAAYAFRVIGLQLRQAGSLRLNLQPDAASTPEPYMAPVAFETDYTDPYDSSSFSIKSHTLSGKNAPGAGEYALSVGYRNFTEPVFTSSSAQSLQRNCLGGNGTNALVLSEFVLFAPSTDPAIRELRCNGNGQVQPIINNVASFQVRYLLQDTTTTPGISTITPVDADGVTNWTQVQAVEVCLVLFGTEPIELPATPPANDPSTSYRDCNGTLTDMRTLASPRTRRMHVAFRNTFQLRSQGLVGSVL